MLTTLRWTFSTASTTADRRDGDAAQTRPPIEASATTNTARAKVSFPIRPSSRLVNGVGTAVVPTAIDRDALVSTRSRPLRLPILLPVAPPGLVLDRFPFLPA